MKLAKKVKTFTVASGERVGIVREYARGRPGWYYCVRPGIGEGTRQGDNPRKLATECGYSLYICDWEHRCEGPGCNRPTTYTYCAYCHFENRNPGDTMIGILGM